MSSNSLPPSSPHSPDLSPRSSPDHASTNHLPHLPSSPPLTHQALSDPPSLPERIAHIHSDPFGPFDHRNPHLHASTPSYHSAAASSLPSNPSRSPTPERTPHRSNMASPSGDPAPPSADSDIPSSAPSLHPRRIHSTPSIPTNAPPSTPLASLIRAGLDTPGPASPPRRADAAPLAEPGDAIAPFPWAQLETRYAELVREFDVQEEEMREEWERVIAYFQIWARTSTDAEVERATKRLKTRVYHVQQSEQTLEQKRQHYLRAVEAFQSALKLLEGS